MTTTIQVIDKQTYDSEYKEQVGSLLFSDDYYDAKRLVNTSKLRNNLIEDGFNIIKGSRIIAVLIQTKSHPNFKNKLNNKVPYKYPVCSIKDAEGAYYDDGMYYTDYPLGDVICVFNKL